MKIGVIGANGNLGNKIVKQALDRGLDVKAFVYMGTCLDQRVESIQKNMFDLTKEDICDLDVIISAFGSGFKADPTINKKAFLQYIALLKDTNIKLVTIAGAGSLYSDSSHTLYEYETENHPSKLKEISKNIRLGIDELEKEKSFNWTVVCPSRRFDLNGSFSKDYIIGTDCEIIYNEDQQSYVTYDDLAKAMIDISVQDLYQHQVVTVASLKGGVENGIS